MRLEQLILGLCLVTLLSSSGSAEYPDKERSVETLLVKAAQAAGLERDPEVMRYHDEQMVQLFVREEIDEKFPMSSISEAEMQAFYKTHIDEYRRAEMRRASHLVVATLAEASELIEKARAMDHSEFVRLVRKHSLDAETKLRGGDLLAFDREGRPLGGRDTKIDSSLVDAAFSLKQVGDVTLRPIKLAENRWSIVRLTALTPEKLRSFAEVRALIQRRLWRDQRVLKFKELVRDIRKRMQPKVFLTRAQAIVLPSFPRSPKGIEAGR